MIHTKFDGDRINGLGLVHKSRLYHVQMAKKSNMADFKDLSDLAENKDYNSRANGAKIINKNVP